MPNLTISLSERLHKSLRDYARQHNTSVNALLRSMLRNLVGEDRGHDWTEECFRRMDQANGHSGGRTWKRDDLYDV